MSIYRSPRGRRELAQSYDRAVSALPVDIEERYVETRHGRTHVLECGPADGPPVIVFQGGNATNPMTLAWYASLADTFHLIAPDTIGHPGKSAETRPAPIGDGYGEWVVDVLDVLSVESAPMIGTSYGAGIVLRTAAVAPDRIDRALLVVPAGFGTGSIRSMAAVGLPSLAYRYVAAEWLLDRVLSRIVTEPNREPIVRETVGRSLRHVVLERRFPTATAAELETFDAPVAVFVGENDPFFPPRTVIPAAQSRLPRLVHGETLVGERHILSPAARQRVAAYADEFVQD